MKNFTLLDIEKTKPIKANFILPGACKKQECQELFGIWIAGMLEFFDGFDILPV